jgi:recombination protein RecR
MLKGPRERPVALADALVQMTERLRPCARCHSFAEDELCPICADPRRDPSVLCVVEEPSAILPIERTHEFRGRYHVLGGALSPIDGVDPEDLRIEELAARVEAEGVREVVVATNPTMSGEATALYLADVLRGRVRMTRLASGLPVGADLEHADELTLGRALLGRREI